MGTEKVVDVAIVGGGPAGATAGGFLKKFNPSLNVLIIEREQFPRDHVGESQLPPCCQILNELGCWDKVEAAEFPIKIGATYRWGRTPELWHFEFLPSEAFVDAPRPGKYEGQRLATAFQVDRAVYDKILLDHARELGCEVMEQAKVRRVVTSGEAVDRLELENGDTVQARHYVDASGSSGIIRRAFNIDCDYPTALRNIAIWDYWQNTEWAVEIGVGGTRIQILSLPYGWIWFIPLGPTRTSIGLVIPADYLKESGEKPADLYARALREEPVVAALIQNATPEDNLQTTKDWSFLAKRLSGPNWFLAGESAGFADPILSAGMTMAHMAGREAAFTILELDRGTADPAWLHEQFALRQSERIVTHIRFADYWYTANAQFEDLQELSGELARSAGLELSPEKAWAWLAQGGFINEDATFGTGGFSLSFVKNSGAFLAELAVDSPLEKNNVFALDLSGASWKDRAGYRNGGVFKDQCYIRGDRVLPIRGVFDLVVHLLQLEKTSAGILKRVRSEVEHRRNDRDYMTEVKQVPLALEAMILDGWVRASLDSSLPFLPSRNTFEMVRWDHEVPSGVAQHK